MVGRLFCHGKGAACGLSVPWPAAAGIRPVVKAKHRTGDGLMRAEAERKGRYGRSRRGMLELDVLLLPFLEEVYSSLDPEDQARYKRLLECEDQDMFVWFMQRGEPEDPDLRRIVRMILDRVQPD